MSSSSSSSSSSFLLHPPQNYTLLLSDSLMDFDLENPLTYSDVLHLGMHPSLFLIESDHMPSPNYLRTLKVKDFDVSFRQEAISSILQASCNFDPFLSYLAINYLDRFLSNQGMPQLKPRVVRLLAVSCVSLAAKMKKTEFCLTDIQGDGGFVFDTCSIQRMEMIILGALKWRMRSVTPFSFVSFFISLFKFKDPPLTQPLKARATQIIFKAQHDIKVLGYKPSVTAASALLCAAHELFPLQFSCCRKALSNCSYINKESMMQCYNAMQEIAMEGYESVSDRVSSSDTPDNVLDRHFSSSESEKTHEMESIIISTNNNNAAAAAAAAKWADDIDIKRRKISGFCNNRTVQLNFSDHTTVLMMMKD